MIAFDAGLSLRHLDRHVDVQFRVAGKVDIAHSALTQQLANLEVAKPIARRGHCAEWHIGRGQRVRRGVAARPGPACVLLGRRRFVRKGRANQFAVTGKPRLYSSAVGCWPSCRR